MVGKPNPQTISMTNSPTKKFTKLEAGYGYAHNILYSCGTCSMFRNHGNPGTCTLVKGNIYRADTCDHWEKK